MNQRRTFIIFFAALFILLGGTIILTYISDLRLEKYQFNGVVQNVTYDIKGIPEIMITGNKLSSISILGFWEENRKGWFVNKKEKFNGN